MSYTTERDEFISRATAEGLDLDTCRKLLRYATTLQRLAEAQCNGDWPYNGDRDQPNAVESTCADCKGKGEMETGIGMFPCDTCHGNGRTWHRDAERDARHDLRYAVCPKCEASGVAKSAMRSSVETENRCATCNEEGPAGGSLQKAVHRYGPTKHTFRPKPLKVCPDCRTQELVRALLANRGGSDNEGLMQHEIEAFNRNITPIFQGDPRGAVLRLATPGYPWSDDGSKGYGLYVPARVR